MSVICTVGIPVYNRKDAALRAVRSALEQNIEGLEVIVVDDGSSDGAAEAIEAIQDSRLKVIRNEKNLGLFQNFNRCLELAQGTYFRLLCTDDTLPPDTLEAEISLMQSDEEIAILSTSGILCDLAGQPLERFAIWLPEGLYPREHALRSVIGWNCRYALNAQNYPSGILVKTEHARAVGGYETNWKMMGDIDFFLRLTQKGKLCVSRHVGCHITTHSEQVGTGLALMPDVSLEFIRIIEKYREVTGDEFCNVCLRYVFSFWLHNIIRLGLQGKTQAMRSSLRLLREHSKKYNIPLWSTALRIFKIVVDRLRLKPQRRLQTTA